MNKIKEWITGFIVKKLVKLALKKADMQPYAIKGAEVADKYLDKYLGEKNSEDVQNQVIIWIDGLVTSFTTELQKDQK